MRVLAAIVILAAIALALLAANRSRPLLVEARVQVKQPEPVRLFDLCPVDTPKDPGRIHSA